ncbi:hypothetical protein GUJ93_ZPchr0001g31126 [Zizania palustris]|uniref:SAM-dependent methyltransferase Erg6/SMT-type domain-containing protein n=1 Tax=Zizania palustris TaxID=103762 RepID=A0A8J5RQI0_ZIZPA|nr:hypothetical protein GUJ93_ZPchr0001g31126 [Zizania palustris]
MMVRYKKLTYILLRHINANIVPVTSNGGKREGGWLQEQGPHIPPAPVILRIVVNKYYDLATSFYEYGWVTGLNNNEYQITRGKELNRLARVSAICDFVKEDFMEMLFSNNTFDAIYAIEATCHAPYLVGCYKEIYHVLKLG